MVLPTFLPRIHPSSPLSPDDLHTLLLLGPLLIPAADPSTQTTIAAIQALPFPEAHEYWVDAADEGADGVVAFLNDGAEKVLVGLKELEELRTVQIPRDRLVLSITEDDLDLELPLAPVSGLIINTTSLEINLSHLNTLRSSLPSPGLIFLSPPSDFIPSLTEISSLYSLLTPLVLPTSLFPTQFSIPETFLSPLTSDRPDSLFPTIVSSPSAPSALPLGLVYSSLESLTELLKTRTGVYQSRKQIGKSLWYKGATSGSTQQVRRVRIDCDSDAVLVEVEQAGSGFCHLGTPTCFSPSPAVPSTLAGISLLEQTLLTRLPPNTPPAGSYTARLLSDKALLHAKILEEASELVQAQTKDEIAFEMADVVYFGMVKCLANGVAWADVERALDKKAGRVGARRVGNAKGEFVKKLAEMENGATASGAAKVQEIPVKKDSTEDAPVPKDFPATTEASTAAGPAIRMRTSTLSSLSPIDAAALLKRPVLDSTAMLAKVQPIISAVRTGGDAALLSFTAQFDRVQLESNVLHPPFYQSSVDRLSDAVIGAIEQAYKNIYKFHAAQASEKTLEVETMPGVVCRRFARPIDRVGIYVPGGTAILPSTALMLGIPAQVAGCRTIVLATPPRKDGSISPEVLYVADLVGASVILKAGGAQAVAALAYGTGEVPKVDKIFGPGNQWVTAAKMVVQNDTSALVGIDMPAGPSEVMVIADHTANPIFVASDLLSQAEHGIDSQVVLVAIDLTPAHLAEIETEVDRQANALPRVEIIKQAVVKSLIVKVAGLEEAMTFSNEYAPEHLILHLEKASEAVEFVNNAGSVFVGAFSPESCGDYASGTNHTLPTYGYARQFSGVNTLSFQKHITSQELTKEGLAVLGPVVITLAECEGLEAHANAVRVRLADMRKNL